MRFILLVSCLLFTVSDTAEDRRINNISRNFSIKYSVNYHPICNNHRCGDTCEKILYNKTELVDCVKTYTLFCPLSEHINRNIYEASWLDFKLLVFAILLMVIGMIFKNHDIIERGMVLLVFAACLLAVLISQLITAANSLIDGLHCF